MSKILIFVKIPTFSKLSTCCSSLVSLSLGSNVSKVACLSLGTPFGLGGVTGSFDLQPELS